MSLEPITQAQQPAPTIGAVMTGEIYFFDDDIMGKL